MTAEFHDFAEHSMSAHGTPEQIRNNLGHPVIDGDGHIVEYGPT